MRKIIISLIFALLGSAVAVSPVFAQAEGVNSRSEQMEGSNPQATGSGNQRGESLVALKKSATGRIDKRIEMLQKLSAQVDSNQKLDMMAKEEIKRELAAVIARLTALKTEVGSTNDAQTLQAVFKKVLDEKVYAIVMQKIQLMHLINKLSQSLMRVEELAKKLDELANTLESEGIDVSDLKQNITDIKTQITTLKEVLASSKLKVSNATAVDYKQIFSEVRLDITKVRSGFVVIKNLITQVKNEIRLLNNGSAPDVTTTPTSTGSSVLTPTSGL